jgi:hypothetical protein
MEQAYYATLNFLRNRLTGQINLQEGHGIRIS